MLDKPITVAVLADTHVDRLDQLPRKVLDTLTKADVVIHLGDFTSLELLNDLRKLNNFYGIYGNHDRLPALRKELKKLEIIDIGGKRLGLIHGFFYPVGTQRRMKYWFRKYNIDILLYGHSHFPVRKYIDGVFLFNPGTVTCKFPATQGSFGLLTINGSFTTEIIHTDNNFPLKWKLLVLVPAFIIRNGTRFLETWPYVDASPLVKLVRLVRGKISFNFKKLVLRQKFNQVIPDINPERRWQ